MIDAAIDSRPVRVLIVDDTRTIRAMIRAMLSRSPLIEVVGEAGDPYEARELIRQLEPDVITLDVEMPRMDGLSFLEKIMRLRPMPVVMVSTRTTERSHAAVRALALGAIDCVDIARLKEAGWRSPDLVDTVLMAASSRPRRLVEKLAPGAASEVTRFGWNGRVVVIGSSTGGVDALLTVLADYPEDGPPTVIAQHMPAAFLESFTARLDRHLRPRVVPAEDGMRMAAGLVCVAPGGDRHVALSPRDPLRLQSLTDDGKATYVPSVDILFSSAERHGGSVIGVMLTGMGRDGAHAMARMRQAGAHTIVQDAASAVVDGMPRAAREAGAAVEVASLAEIGSRILASASRAQGALT
jgi:two-component system chemotaxis response regulator CheB